LASRSTSVHLVRGAVGLIAAGLAIALLASVGPLSLALLPLTALAWRGCPTCWAVGLFGTLADDRARRSCRGAEGGCRQAGRDAGFQTED
jgi:hypothetical protein